MRVADRVLRVADGVGRVADKVGRVAGSGPRFARKKLRVVFCALVVVPGCGPRLRVVFFARC